ncbi:MAG TPA: MFS transporter [Steroidobacteraceae bacterium]|nr:MFS transporter [Steroidobacteraceae bacterium]
MNTPLQSPCDAAAAQRAQVTAAPAHPSLVLAATILASSLAFVDGSVVNVGLPAIGRNLGADAAGLQWVVNAYLLPLSALLLLGGAAGDRFGRRRFLIVGTVLFGITSVACALATNVTSLLLARFLQGVSSALLMPNSLAILGATFQGEAKGRAVGIWAATGAAVGAAGPVLGGWLIDLGSWRGIFLINVPLAAAAIVLAWRYIPADRCLRVQPLDLSGGLWATFGLGALTWALTVGSGRSGWSTASLTAAAAALIALGVFVLVEQRRGERAMMPLALFASSSFIGLTLLTLFLYGALGAVFVLIPYVLIETAHYSATAAGAALLPLPVVLAVTSPFMGGVAGRIGSRWPLAIGPLIVAAGFGLALRIGAHADYWTEVLPALLIMAFGLSGAVAPLTTAILSSVDAAHTGSASGFNSAVARSGGLIATALLGSVLAAKGLSLIGTFHIAMLACALACVASSASAYFLLKSQRAPVARS